MRFTRQATALFLLVTFAGCENPVDPRLPNDATRFTAPLVYQRWWRMVEECSGRTGLLEGVSWYTTSQPLTDPTTGEHLAGYWSPASNRIVLGDLFKLDGPVVRHEMLHALLRGGGHPYGVFLGSCAGVVHCSAECVPSGSFPPPDPNAVMVNSDAIQVTLTVEPASPSVSNGDGFFEMIVTAKNPASHAVRVTLPTTGPFFVFGYQLREANGAGSFGGSDLFDDNERSFAAGETKKHVFDVSLAGVGNLTADAGSYVATGDYGHNSSAPVNVVVLP